MIKLNGVGGIHPPFGIYVNFRVLIGIQEITLAGYTATLTNGPSGKIRLVFVEGQRVFFASAVLEWEERLPTREEFERDAVFYMPSVAGKGELGPLSSEVQSAVVLDRTLSTEGQLYIWEWSNGAWSQDAIQIIRNPNN